VKLAVAATAPLGADVLERLAAQHDIEFLLTRPDRPRGRGRKVGSPPAKDAAERLGIPVRQDERLDETFSFDGADTVVVAAYGALIPSSLLDRASWLNVHPSLLPRWRGAAPVERAVMAGDTETGVTIHRTTAELDAGPIAAQRSFPIGPEDDAGLVYAQAGALAAELLEEVLSGEPEFTVQPEEGATYAERLTTADRGLDWSRSPTELLNRIRALSPHIGARGEVGGRVLTIWRAAPAGPESELVAGGLELLEVQPEGRRRMSGEEYLRGLRGSGA
jgi:methionyl-tRNA formyltransferase